jgi:hypothetical protein
MQTVMQKFQEIYVHEMQSVLQLLGALCGALGQSSHPVTFMIAT